MNDGISIIISTYNRSEQLLKIITNLDKQSKDHKTEIIIVDSFSEDNSEYLIKNLKAKLFNKNINYYNIKQNILSAKRNFGIFNSKYSKIILLDDDCIPLDNFIEEYNIDFQNIDNKTILSGVVNYSDTELNKSSFLRFRKKKHFQVEHVKKNFNIQIKNFVAMNMGFINHEKIKKIGFFDERFLGYGFEDYEFAYRMKQHGYNLHQTKASILHDEGNICLSKYLKKYYHLGRDGMKNLLIINKEAAKTTVYYKIENNFFIKTIINISLLISLLSVYEKLLLFIEKYFFYKPDFLYNFGRLIAYLRGTQKRHKSNIYDIKKNWYE